jgi:uncharacterized protein (TIGR03066 family)
LQNGFPNPKILHEQPGTGCTFHPRKDNAMKMLRFVLSAFVVAGLSSPAMAADDKVDVKKLIVGKWEAVKVDENTLPKGAVVEFTADGKLKVTAKNDGKDESVDGTYTLDGSSFTYKLKLGDMELSQKVVIKKISETEMDTANPEGKNVGFKKVK